jgi:hypothetical protein
MKKGYAKTIEVFVNPGSEIDLDAIDTDIFREQGQFSETSGWKPASLQMMREALQSGTDIVITLDGETVLGICSYDIVTASKQVLSIWEYSIPLNAGGEYMDLSFFGAKDSKSATIMINQLQSIAEGDGLIILMDAVDNMSPFASADFIQASPGPEYLYWMPPAIEKMVENGAYSQMDEDIDL